jgi:hypothetical protein
MNSKSRRIILFCILHLLNLKAERKIEKITLFDFNDLFHNIQRNFYVYGTSAGCLKYERKRKVGEESAREECLFCSFVPYLYLHF